MTSQNLTDQEISDVLTYVYNSWGNNKTKVTPEMVKTQKQNQLQKQKICTNNNQINRVNKNEKIVLSAIALIVTGTLISFKLPTTKTSEVVAFQDGNKGKAIYNKTCIIVIRQTDKEFKCISSFSQIRLLK